MSKKESGYWSTIKNLIGSLSSSKVDKSKIEDDILNSGLRDSDKLVNLLRETICFNEAGGKVNVGQSKTGGMPDVAEGIDYPYDKDGKPYIFLAQLNLSELNSIFQIVPYTGMLYFFIQMGGDLSAKERCKIIYSKTDSDLHTLKTPELYMPQNEFPQVRIKPYLAYFLPGFESGELSLLDYKGEDIARYYELHDKVAAYYGTEGVHRFGGYPYLIQGDLRHSWGNNDYDLLFQLCCHEQNFKNRFSDAIIYFGLDRNSINACEFKEAVWSAQMT